MLKNLVNLAIFTFVIILSWIAFGIYHSYTKSTISSDTGILISPVPAHFDLDVVKNIASRKVVAANLSQQSPNATSSSKPTPTQAPIIVSPTPVILVTPTIFLPIPQPTQPATNSAQVNL